MVAAAAAGVEAAATARPAVGAAIFTPIAGGRHGAEDCLVATRRVVVVALHAAA